MDDSMENKVSELLQQGLELYGTGEVSQAFLLWREVMRLDPGNAEALDYIRDADRRSKPRGDGPKAAERDVVDEARRFIHAENEEAALELLSNAPHAGGMEAEAMVELLRARLYHRYRMSLGDLSRTPRVSRDAAADLGSRNLPPSAGFLLSMVDDSTPLCDLVSVSGMDRFEALRSVYQMVEAGILEWEE